MIRYDNNTSYTNRNNKYYLNDNTNTSSTYSSDCDKSEIVNLSGYLIYLTINYNGNVKLYGK